MADLESETIPFATTHIQAGESSSNSNTKTPKPNPVRIPKRNKVHVAIVSSLCVVALSFLVIVLVLLFVAEGNLKPQNQKITHPQIWQITIGNKALSEQQISSNILVIPKDLPHKRPLLLMREVSVDFIGFDDNLTNNLNTTTIPDVIIELNEQYSIHKILTAKNESSNEVLYAFSYLYETCFVEYDNTCGVVVDYNYSTFCNPCCGEPDAMNGDIVMQIELVESLSDTNAVSSGVAESMMHQMLSRYTDDNPSGNDLSGYIDNTVYTERDWFQYSWPIDEENNDNSTRDHEEEQNVDRSGRRNLQSAVIDGITQNLPADYQGQLTDALASLFDDTLWVETCGFLLPGCDFYQESVDSGSFSRWYLGSYYWGVERLCVDFQALPYVASEVVKNTNENTGTIELTIDLKPYDEETPAVKATVSAYTRQKLCIGVLFGEWCYRDVRDDVDVEFQINPSFTIEVFYGISMDAQATEFVVEVGLIDTTTTVSQCDFQYDHNGDRSLGDNLSKLIPLISILPLVYDQGVKFTLEIMDDKICPLAQEYSQDYVSAQVEKIFMADFSYLVSLDDTDIQIKNELMYLYHDKWLEPAFDFSSAFGINDVCKEILE